MLVLVLICNPNVSTEIVWWFCCSVGGVFGDVLGLFLHSGLIVYGAH